MTDDQLTDNDVVISSRIRLVRNIANFPFPGVCSADQLDEIESLIKSRLATSTELSEVAFDEGSVLELLQNLFLADLNSANQCFDATPSFQQPNFVTGCPSVATSIDINSDDHLTFLVTRADGNLPATWEFTNQLDDLVEQHFSYAFSQRWGYLTASPADIGTGLRATVVLHLPGLSLTDQTGRIFRSLLRGNVIGRQVTLEPHVVEIENAADEPLHDLYRISNLTTLGITEEELVDQVNRVIPTIVDCEREARDVLLTQPQSALEQQVSDAVEQLCQLTLVGVKNDALTTNLMARVRLGVGLGLISRETTTRVLQCFSLSQRRQQLNAAIAGEEYQQAAILRDQIRILQTEIDSAGEDE